MVKGNQDKDKNVESSNLLTYLQRRLAQANKVCFCKPLKGQQAIALKLLNIWRLAKAKSFFAAFPLDKIFEHVNTSNNLLEVANKLGFNDPTGLKRIDYSYFEEIKTRENWNTFVLADPKGWAKEKTRKAHIKQLSAEELQAAVELEGISSLSTLAVHYLLSSKHGRKTMRESLLALSINIPDTLYKGVHGVTRTPIHWPTQNYEKRVEKKTNGMS